MTVTYINVERLLEDYNAEDLIICYGNQNKEEPYLEIKINKNVAKSKHINYSVKDISNTGEVTYNNVALVGNDISQQDIINNYIDIGLMKPDGTWINRRDVS
jgi:hypothetical protein